MTGRRIFQSLPKNGALFSVASTAAGVSSFCCLSRAEDSVFPNAFRDCADDGDPKLSKTILITAQRNGVLPLPMFAATKCDYFASSTVVSESFKSSSTKLGTTLATNSKEEERYQTALDQHRGNLTRYKEYWDPSPKAADTSHESPIASTTIGTSWEIDLPSPEELSALKLEMKFCSRSPNFRDDETYCDMVKFRVAAALLAQSSENIIGYKDSVHIRNSGDGEDELRNKKMDSRVTRSKNSSNSGSSSNSTGGYGALYLMKDLAERGHADGMCMYATCLSEGRGGLDPNPDLAVVWWRRCAELHQYPQALYELGIAFYTGEGVVESEVDAANFFRIAADLGHTGAVFMYGDCLLEGIGVTRDRAKGIQRLIDAAKSGHRGARSRVLKMLEKKGDDEDDDVGLLEDGSRKKATSPSTTTVVAIRDDDDSKGYGYDEDDEFNDNEEATQRFPSHLSERRFTMGGLCPPSVIARRRTLVEESRRK